MKPKAKTSFRLRIQSHKSINPNSKVTATVARKHTDGKNRQLDEAVKWCNENKARGGSALKTGLFPLIKDRQTINRRLDGKVATGGEREYCKTLTCDEEMYVVRFTKNNNRAYQPLNKEDLTKLILNILRLRDHTNKQHKGGRKYVKLSANAKSALQRNRLSRPFWLDFMRRILVSPLKDKVIYQSTGLLIAQGRWRVLI